mmetsp:Transcript_1741/g.4385  ORF Transcript_1741/g.4385 Transcript_1741/m.4385 type:complete len:426 (+) Transcript_1741:121-1398(+)
MKTGNTAVNAAVQPRPLGSLQHGLRLRPASLKRRPTVPAAAKSNDVDQGFSILTLTNKVFPQGAFVSGVKESWRLAWSLMVKELAPQDRSGAYQRPANTFTGVIGSPQFPDEAGRYHVYVGNACPWCHRVLLAMVLKGMLRPMPSASGGPQRPSVSFTQLGSDPTKARRGGWIFDPKLGKDPIWGAQDLWEVYETASPGFRGRCTAPLLVDASTRRIVSNESADIVRMIGASQMPGTTSVDLYPSHLRGQIDELNDKVYRSVNNGVYRSGFSTSQQAYDAVQREMFSTLDDLEARLSQSRFLLGDRLTEADIRLLPTISRFDAVYASIFKCNKKRIMDYPNLSAWLRDMWQIKVDGSSLQVCDTLDIDAARHSYHSSLFPLNPSGIVPFGPTQADLNLEEPHGRGSSNKLEDVCYMTAPAVHASR